MIDPIQREFLLKQIRTQPEHSQGQALVTIAEFFGGNNDLGSIGCNLTDHPGINHFQHVLGGIESQPNIEAIWIQIYDLEEGEWPFSENVLIFGTMPLSEIKWLTESLEPSEVRESQVDWTPSRAKHLAGRRFVNLWWD